MTDLTELPDNLLDNLAIRELTAPQTRAVGALPDVIADIEACPKPVVAAAFRDKTLVWGIVTGVIKGGVEVDVEGLRAFAPASHMDLRMGASLQPLVGKRLAFAVTTYAKRGRDVVLSRRAMLEADAKAHREEALAKLEMNAVVDGVVRTVVQFGAFVDVGGVEGLVPLSEMSHNRADQPKDVFKVGETVKVKILRVDEKGKLWLSRRQATPDPWGEVAQKYAMGTRHTGKIVRIQPFGAFVELESGIDGLIHTADLSYKRIEKPEDVVKVGDELEVVVAHLDAGHHRIGLHPALTGDQANEQPQKVAPHKMVKCVVVQIDPNGLQVRILGATGRHARAFITAAATGTPRGTDLRKSFPVGKEMDAKVLEIDPRRGEVKLSVKAFNEENERSAYQQYRAQVKRAGTVILTVAIVLWVMAHLPLRDGKPPAIEDSVAGTIGRAVEPIIKPLGFNWKIGIGLITSLAAREVIVGTLGTIYGIEGEAASEDSVGLQKALQKDLTLGGAVALLIFFAFAMQCMSTLAVVRRETGGWKWPILQFSYMSFLAYAGAAIANWLV